MKRVLSSILLVVLGSVLLASCSKNEGGEVSVSMSLGEVSRTSVGACVNAEISSGSVGYYVGIVVSEGDPTAHEITIGGGDGIQEDGTYMSYKNCPSGKGSYDFSLSELAPGVEYNIAAFVYSRHDNLEWWSNTLSFKTLVPEIPSLEDIYFPSISAEKVDILAVWEDNGAPITEAGVVISGKEEVLAGIKSIADMDKAPEGDLIIVRGAVNEVVTICMLDPLTDYYCKAYAVNAAGEAFSDIDSFTTCDITRGNTIDLGLSVKWSDRNIGAESESESGSFYSWGETQTKEKGTFLWENYTYISFSETARGDGESDAPGYAMTKYCTSDRYGHTDNLVTLEASDDAATANWGEDWRTPTYEEFQELLDKCTFTSETIDGIKGYRATGPSGASIFFPATGTGSANSANNMYGSFWSSSLYEKKPYLAHCFYFFVDSAPRTDGTFLRSDGRAVRPVYTK